MKNRLRARSVCMASAATLALSLVGGTAFAAKDPGVAQPGVGPAVVAGASSFRLAGADRYETAVVISQKWFNTDAHPKTVYVASGENFPDALAAAPIAGMNRAPVLLTPAAKLPDKVLAEINRLKPTRVVVVGGKSVVSDAVVSQLAGVQTVSGDAVKVERVFGADRYATARAVIKDGMITNPDFAVTQTHLTALADALADMVAQNYQIALTSTPAYVNEGKADGDHSTKPAYAFTAAQKEAIKNVRANYATAALAELKKLPALAQVLRMPSTMAAAKDQVGKFILDELSAAPGSVYEKLNVFGGNIDKAYLAKTSSVKTVATIEAELTPVAGAATLNSKNAATDRIIDSGVALNANNGVLKLAKNAIAMQGLALQYNFCSIDKTGVLSSTTGKKKDCAALSTIYSNALGNYWTFFDKKEEKALLKLQSNKAETLSFYFATGTNFPDALAIGAVAGNWYGGQAGPVFLEYGTTTSVADENRRLMAELAGMYSVNYKLATSLSNGDAGTFRTYVIGGTGVMSDELKASIETVDYSEMQTAGNYKVTTKIVDGGKAIRIGGKDRYETSQMIVSTLKKAYVDGDVRQGLLATGVNFPDALAGSAYAAASNSALWVTPGNCVTPGIAPMASSLKIGQFGLLGGVGALTEAVDSLSTCA